MKAAIDHSIGAALRACAPQTAAREPQALFARAGSRDHRSERNQRSEQNRGVAPDLDVGQDRDFRRDCPAATTHLTPRQLEVLALLCEGLQNKVICRRLNIASGTAKVHISCIFRELGVASRLAAVVEAQRRGLVKLGNALPDRNRDLLDALIQPRGRPNTLSISAKQAAGVATGLGTERNLMMAA